MAELTPRVTQIPKKAKPHAQKDLFLPPISTTTVNHNKTKQPLVLCCKGTQQQRIITLSLTHIQLSKLQQTSRTGSHKNRGL
jgi:hypothetical protein